MNIFYDHQIFTWQRYGGISRYFSELIDFIDREKRHKAILPKMISENSYLKSDKKFTLSMLKYVNFKIRKRLANVVNIYFSKQGLRNFQFDIFHPTYYSPYFLSMNIKKPMVVTVYDMIHELFLGYFYPFDKTTTHKKKLIERADKIIAISESTKRDLCRLFNVPEKKVSVVLLASSFDKICPKAMDIPERFLLFVGPRKGYKNFRFFLQTVGCLLKSKVVVLVCAGGGGFTAEEAQLIKELEVSEYIIQKDVDDSELKFLYQHALAFVFPSLYEGFGIPILEAFSSGCPVLLSRSSSFPEVASEAGIYFDPQNKESILESTSFVLDKDFDRQGFVNKGYTVLNNFSWDKTAKQTLEIYKELL